MGFLFSHFPPETPRTDLAIVNFLLLPLNLFFFFFKKKKSSPVPVSLEPLPLTTPLLTVMFPLLLGAVQDRYMYSR